APFVEGAGLGSAIPPRRGRRNEGVRPLRTPRGEDRSQPGELIYADLGVAQCLGARLAVARARAIAAARLEKGLQHVEGERKDDRRVVVHADVEQRLQVAKLEGRRVAGEDLSRLEELL